METGTIDAVLDAMIQKSREANPEQPDDYLPDIAELCMQRDIAEVVYKASMEAINVYKLEVNLLREQIDREWNRA